MKVTIALILLLIAGGAALGFVTYQTNVNNDDDTHINILDIISEVRQLDSTINTLILKSRYGLIPDYDELARLTVNLRERFNDLKATPLSKYATQNEEINTYVTDFNEQLKLKIDLIENFKSHNAVLRNSIKYAPRLGDTLIAQVEKDGKQKAMTQLKIINNALYRWALYNESDEARIIEQNASSILDLQNAVKDEVALLEYSSHLAAVVSEQEQTQRYIQSALDVPTDTTLNRLDSTYIAYHLDVVKEASKIRYYILGYALLALAIAIYLGSMLKRSYSRLEEKVEDRTQQISTAYEHLKESQEQLIQSEKMASLGQMVAGIAHEINTPLGYVNNNVAIVRDSFSSMHDTLKHLGVIYKEAKQKPHNSKKINSTLISALKQYRTLENDDVINEASELLDDSNHGLDEISELVNNLKNFSRLDRQSAEYFNLHEGINATLKIAGSTLKHHNVSVVKDYHDLPDIECIPSKLNQVFLNIITNAAQAMPESGGNLIITTELEEDGVRIIFKDTGEGMSEETRNKIFDPFYTTKPIGEGTGLGMSISYKIVKSHHGKIEVITGEDVGAAVVVSLPLAQPEHNDDG